MRGQAHRIRLRSDGVADWMIDAMHEEARQRDRSLDAYLEEVGLAVPLGKTKTRVRCHFVVRGADGQVRVDKLAKMLTREIVEYCIPRERIREARQRPTTAPLLALQQEAKALFAPVLTSGEPGELLLYLLLESLLELPQLFCKMSLKTNSKMHVHGADGVHGEILHDGKLALYWGESKLHARVNQAIDDALSSLAPYLTSDSNGAVKNDMLLLRSGVNLKNPDLVAALARFFDDDAPESNMVEFRGAALVGFDLADYPVPHDEEKKIVTEVEDAIRSWHERIAARVAEHKISAITIEVFCVPFPSVAQLRSDVIRELGLDISNG